MLAPILLPFPPASRITDTLFSSTTACVSETPAEQQILNNLGFFKDWIFRFLYTVVKANEARDLVGRRKLGAKNRGKGEGEAEREAEKGGELVN